ncbi:tRNA-specific adenosine deaminase [Candidatus Woesearchaeota archaeon CG11_big_fil_rev_8_21_14_0_20_43_8]|nr:MAG: tRNA-specific adenosine deaminase [Candidatus Woesearchaeota archaeon CG11_big_fil_rev_8_21_14_0_20_43_8]PIO05606.1 MAG: nucleoside deaminase [Candidatus Woesearchaeota archaeon CG08_land_8_20_14_0_20_43_7]
MSMELAVEEAKKGMKRNEGGPFGAVIKRNGKIIAIAHNTVLKEKDPTCHAEINAIKKACKRLKRFDLSDCEIYSTCEPCPMCLSAILWARIKTLHYSSTRKDAKEAGFDDSEFYDVFSGKKKSKLKVIKQKTKNSLFHECMEKEDKVLY